MKFIDLKSKIQFSPVKMNRDAVFSSPELNINLYCLEVGQKLESCHCKEPTILYCVGGEGYFFQNSEKVLARYGSMLICDQKDECRADAKERFVILKISGVKNA